MRDYFKIKEIIKRVAIVTTIAVLTFAMTACGSKDNVTASGVSSSTVNSASGDQSTQTNQESEDSGTEVESGIKLTQIIPGESDDSKPFFLLREDGTFQFRVVSYDGIVLQEGHYVESGDTYILTPEKSNTQGDIGKDLSEITLTPQGELWIYAGSEVGYTPNGSEFERS